MPRMWKEAGVRAWEEEQVELVDGESGMLDLCGVVAAEVAAAEQRRPGR